MIRTIALLALILAGPATTRAVAEDVPMTGFSECIATQIEDGAPLAACITDAHAECLQYAPASAAGTLCFTEAKKKWGAKIAERMQTMTAALDETETAVLNIELKYSLQRNLTACDRQMELAQLSEDLPEGALPYQRANCEATAVATSLVELTLLSRRMGE